MLFRTRFASINDPECSLMTSAIWVHWSINFRHATDNWEWTIKIFTLKWGKDNETATSFFRYISEAIKKGSYKFALYVCLRYIGIGQIKGKGSHDLLISWIANRINNISTHSKRIYDFCLCNILVPKIPKIRVCNPSPFRKTCFGHHWRGDVPCYLKLRSRCFFCWATFVVHNSWAPFLIFASNYEIFEKVSFDP